MTEATDPHILRNNGITAPLKHVYFRRIWFASLLSNLGILIQGVGAAWAMTQMTSAADKVALVQTALMIPFMLISIPAGAIADMHDRRIVALISLGISLTGATALTILASFGLVTPNVLLALCFVVGCGMALMVPAWQASISEQVPAAAVPAAVTLNGISYNIARSVGPAIGGVVVATAGAVAAFALNALLYLPLIRALCLWKRVSESPRLPPESLGRAMVSGVRYIVHSPAMRILLGRSLVIGVIGAAIIALMPLVARDILHGGAGTYGLLLSAFGFGAVVGALNLTHVRQRLSDEAIIRASTVSMGAAIFVVALVPMPVCTAVALIAAGAVWMIAWNVFSIGVQLSVPRWVAGRSLAAYQAAGTGGVAIGSWGWGHLTDAVGVETALIVSATLLLFSGFIGLWVRMPAIGARGEDGEMLEHPVARLPLTMRSGPVIVEIEYRVAQASAQSFYEAIQDVRRFRQRNGAYGWSIACDVSDPELWTERFSCPTWLDYLRQRNRATKSERALDAKLATFHIGPEPIRVRRMLERPFQVAASASDDLSGDRPAKEHSYYREVKRDTNVDQTVDRPASTAAPQVRNES